MEINENASNLTMRIGSSVRNDSNWMNGCLFDYIERDVSDTTDTETMYQLVI